MGNDPFVKVRCEHGIRPPWQCHDCDEATPTESSIVPDDEGLECEMCDDPAGCPAEHCSFRHNARILALTSTLADERKRVGELEAKLRCCRRAFADVGATAIVADIDASLSKPPSDGE